jgi:hypothetical protein
MCVTSSVLVLSSFVRTKLCRTYGAVLKLQKFYIALPQQGAELRLSGPVFVLLPISLNLFILSQVARGYCDNNRMNGQ